VTEHPRPAPFFGASTPRVFAHRGGSALAPENTIEAFENGMALGADGLELDVRLSRDGVVFVHHDAALDRTTKLRGPLAARRSDELAAANVPTLSAVLERFPAAPIIIEIKVNTDTMAAAVVQVVRAAGATTRVCLGSFGLRVLRAVRALDPAIATSAAQEEVRLALYRSWLRWPVRRPAFQGYQVPEWSGRTHVVTPRFVQHAHLANLQVQVWTVDTEGDARRLLDWGVDALITDRPDLIVPLCRSRR
jgi:glycerophosphoryl diester phosphodiesterase